MTIKFTKRIASQLLNRGENAIRINASAMDDASKAITREDVRRLIGSGGVFALKEKHNVSARSKLLKQKRSEGRSRGPGLRRGTRKARAGISWEKKVRSQRFVLKRLKEMGKLDTVMFNKMYGLVKGGTYASKAAMLLHLKEEGITLTEQETAKINEAFKAQYK